LLTNADAVFLMLVRECEKFMHVPEQHMCFLQCQCRQQVSMCSLSQQLSAL